MANSCELNDAQRKELLALMFQALNDIRSRTHFGVKYSMSDLPPIENYARIYDVADILHNLPSLIFSPDLDVSWLRDDLKELDQKYPGSTYYRDIERIITGNENYLKNEDEFYDDAVAFVIQSQNVSVSLIQRQFNIGYNLAARLVERMQRDGVVSFANAAGKRSVLMQKPNEESVIYEVVFYNDDFTPMEFVVDTLVETFHINTDQAASIMLQIHNEGSGSSGPYIKNKAIRLSRMVMFAAKTAGYPFKCTTRMIIGK